jgi:hypothetical protein
VAFQLILLNSCLSALNKTAWYYPFTAL